MAILPGLPSGEAPSKVLQPGFTEFFQQSQVMQKLQRAELEGKAFHLPVD